LNYSSNRGKSWGCDVTENILRQKFNTGKQCVQWAKGRSKNHTGKGEKKKKSGGQGKKGSIQREGVRGSTEKQGAKRKK